MKNISILGVTGSIGKSALKIIDNYPDDLKLTGVSTNKQVKQLIQIIDKYNPKYALITDENEANILFGSKNKYKNTVILKGFNGLIEFCSDKQNDIILNGISGKAGLLPSVEILKNGINLALANKESIVCGGEILKELSTKNNASIIPVDSEHSAIFHLMKDKKTGEIKNIYLTASGGPFWKLDKSEWKNITIEQALAHPTWKMGNKISIDSATMANKGLEVIEAHKLFGFDYDKVKVLIHPQSLIHSMIETFDGEIYSQIGPNDMSLPIMNAVFYPEIKYNNFNRFNFTEHIKLDLYPMDLEKFKMLEMAYYCGKKGGLYTTFFNCINEYLVDKFLTKEITFIEIEEMTEKYINIFEKDRDIEKINVNMENIGLIDNFCFELVKRK